MQNAIEFAFYAGFTEMCRRVGIAQTVKYAAAQGFSAVEPLEGTSGMSEKQRNCGEF